MLSYHSLEDRITKRVLGDRARSHVPDDLPFVPEGQEPELRLLTRGAEQASPAEIRGEPARGLGAAARRRAGPEGGVSSASGAARARSPRVAEAAAERARLTVVPRTLTRPPQLPFAVLTAVALIGGVVGLLMFNTNMAAASFRVNDLQQQLTALQAREDQLNLSLDKLNDPQRLARRARALGMVPLGSPAFLRLSDGQVLGDPAVASKRHKPAAGRDHVPAGRRSHRASPRPRPLPGPPRRHSRRQARHPTAAAPARVQRSRRAHRDRGGRRTWRGEAG